MANDVGLTTERMPNKWVAGCLGIFPPVGLLYVCRPKLALSYLAFVVCVWLVGVLMLGGPIELPVRLWVWLNGAAIIACVIYCFTNASAVAHTASRPLYSRWYSLATTFLILYGGVLLFRSFVYDTFHIPSESMFPTLTEGSLVIVQKFGFGSYGAVGLTLHRGKMNAAVARGDVIVFHKPEDPITHYISRVVGLPGDQVDYRDGRLRINTAPVPTEEEGHDSLFVYFREQLGTRAVHVAHFPGRPGKDFSAKVPSDEFVVFGDSRDNARDSRYIGFIPKENLVGKAIHAFRARPSGETHPPDATL